MRLFLLFTALFAVSCTKDSTNPNQYCWRCEVDYPTGTRIEYVCREDNNGPSFVDENNNAVGCFCTRTN